MASPEESFKKLLQDNHLCVLATASSSGKPEAATMVYAEDDEHNLYFETFPQYRKYPNLKSNPQVSIVITQDTHSVQMDGTVKELSGSEVEDAKKRLIAKQGGKGFYSDPDIRFFKFTPKWIRVLLGEGYPPEYHVIKE